MWKLSVQPKHAQRRYTDVYFRRAIVTVDFGHVFNFEELYYLGGRAKGHPETNYWDCAERQYTI